MSPPPLERREHARILVETEVTLLVLIPEETVAPHPMRGVTRDLSLSGMRVVTHQTSDAYYRQVIRGIRTAKATLTLPGTGESVTLHGRVVWVEFDSKPNPPVCRYAITFAHASAGEAEALRRCMDAVSRQTLSPIQPAAVIRKNERKDEVPGGGAATSEEPRMNTNRHE